jgi:tetratricopeptide (TPR) repeat protein
MENKKHEHGIIDALVHKIKEHRKPVLCIVAAVLVITAAGGIYNQIKEKAYQDEWGNLFLAELNFVNSKEGSLTPLESFALKYENTPAGAYAANLLGNAYYQTKNYSKAELYFKQAVKEGNKELSALAEVSLVAIYVAQNMFEPAIAQANAFLAKNPAHFAVGQVKHYKALALELSGKKEEAKAEYTQIGQDYPNSYYAAFAALRLEEFK